MKTTQADERTDKTKKTGDVRMGREVSSKKTSDCSENDSKCSDKKKEDTREDRASSLV